VSLVFLDETHKIEADSGTNAEKEPNLSAPKSIINPFDKTFVNFGVKYLHLQKL
jgi:hypothetical protein